MMYSTRPMGRYSACRVLAWYITTEYLPDQSTRLASLLAELGDVLVWLHMYSTLQYLLGLGRGVSCFD